MKGSPNYSILAVFLVLLFATLACATGETSTPTAIPQTDTPIPTVTQTENPTATPRATRTPNVLATQLYDEIFSKVTQFQTDGLIPSTEGEYQRLDDFSRTWAQLGFYQSYTYNLELENFVFTGHVKWSTAVETRDLSGCGIVFGQQEDTSDYAMFLDKSRVYFLSSTADSYSELGKTDGSGRLNFGNPAEADVTLLVYQYRAYVYVDDVFIGQYSLPLSKPYRGRFGYGIISGTNRDYGTSCEITDARIWSFGP